MWSMKRGLAKDFRTNCRAVSWVWQYGVCLRMKPWVNVIKLKTFTFPWVAFNKSDLNFSGLVLSAASFHLSVVFCVNPSSVGHTYLSCVWLRAAKKLPSVYCHVSLECPVHGWRDGICVERIFLPWLLNRLFVWPALTCRVSQKVLLMSLSENGQKWVPDLCRGRRGKRVLS